MQAVGFSPLISRTSLAIASAGASRASRSAAGIAASKLKLTAQVEQIDSDSRPADSFFRQRQGRSERRRRLRSWSDPCAAELVRTGCDQHFKAAPPWLANRNRLRNRLGCGFVFSVATQCTTKTPPSRFRERVVKLLGALRTACQPLARVVTS